MYTPKLFEQTNRSVLFDFIQQHSFGMLASVLDGAPFVTHLPLLLDRSGGADGSLIGHMARANPQWQQAEGQTVLAVFSGPHAYISPAWYEAQNVVPTWNYVAVHAYGTFRAIHEPERMLEIVQEYVDFFEASMPQPWTFDGETEFAKKLVQGIVGFRIEITRLEGKWKLSQNQPVERREKVMQELKRSGNEDANATAELMEKLRSATD